MSENRWEEIRKECRAYGMSMDWGGPFSNSSETEQYALEMACKKLAWLEYKINLAKTAYDTSTPENAALVMFGFLEMEDE